jgi:hypothetical protein
MGYCFLKIATKLSVRRDTVEPPDARCSIFGSKVNKVLGPIEIGCYDLFLFGSKHSGLTSYRDYRDEEPYYACDYFLFD